MSELTFDPRQLRPLRFDDVRFLVVHCTGVAADQSAAEIHAYHRRKGWAGIGYHFVIRQNGDLEVGRPLSYQGAHVEGLNAHSIGVCCTGDGDARPFTDAQRATLRSLLARLCFITGLTPDRVLGHRECYRLPGVAPGTKTCPGTKVDLEEVRREAWTEYRQLLDRIGAQVLPPRAPTPEPAGAALVPPAPFVAEARRRGLPPSVVELARRVTAAVVRSLFAERLPQSVREAALRVVDEVLAADGP